MPEITLKALLPGHRNPIFTVENSQKEHIFFTGGNDLGVVEWSLKKMAFVKVLMPVQSSIYALHAPSFGKNILVVGERSGKVSVFDFEEQKVAAVLAFHSSPVFDIKSSKRLNQLYTASEDGCIGIWSLDTYQKIYSFKASDQTIRAIAIRPDEKQMAVAGKDNVIRIYDMDDFSLLKEITGHTMPVFSLQYAPDGSYLISGSRDAQLKIWNTLDYGLQVNIPAHMYAINHIAFHPTQPCFATASMDKSIKIWSATDFKLYKKLDLTKEASHSKSVNKLVWNTYNEDLISVSDDKLVMIWQVSF
ncbi:WD40 repeat domain-containing protein [Solitalea sp. MAHUQ-68]|uniref:WD40 repeat domain-containing protein n=1 Tax=Solitalea agri TaxID=2953739 RepID=A0A9X2F9C8_9SPHI|nr:WD40 repeat domain-containing protein [Solitalea agri]MCO4294183.1 WD40 repeat domain-containing protein [Solitalea agri]